MTWNRALLGLAVLVVLCAFLGDVGRPNLVAALLAALAGWTALSHFWAASPASPLGEAQRVALYAAVAAAVSMCARRIPTEAVVAATVVVAGWNLAVRAHGAGHGAGSGAQPVGYANALALLCVLGLVLLPGLRRLWWPAAVPLLVVLVWQHSAGADAALVVGLAMYVLRRRRLLVVAVAIAVLFAAPYVHGPNERTHYWRVAAREWVAHPVLGSGAGTYVNWWERTRDVSVQTEEAHSLYLETLAELGLLGLALVVAALAWPLVRTRRADLAAGIAAFAVGAAVDFDWELAGVTVPAIVLAALATSDGPSRPAPLRAVLPVGAAVAAAALLAYA
ncbi:MAG: O-antigen ligase family protein, partial [Actinomycetota bacterium]